MANYQLMNRNIRNIANVLAQAQAEKRKREVETQEMIQKAMLDLQMQKNLAEYKAKLNAQDPLAQLLKTAKVMEALKTLGISFNDISELRGDSSGAPVTPQKIQRQNQVLNARPFDNLSKLRGTEYRPDFFGRLQPTKYEDLGVEQEKKEISKAVDISGQQTENFLKGRSALTRLQNAFSQYMAYSKLMGKEQGGFGTLYKLKGDIGRKLARLRGEERPELSYSGMTQTLGQEVETALALSPILTNQNRIIRSIVSMIKGTLPERGITGTERAGLIRQSLRNAYGIMLGLQKNMFTPEQITKLNNMDSDEMKKALHRLATNALASEEEEKNFEAIWNNVKNTPAAIPENPFLENVEGSDRLKSLLNKYDVLK